MKRNELILKYLKCMIKQQGECRNAQKDLGIKFINEGRSSWADEACLLEIIGVCPLYELTFKKSGDCTRDRDGTAFQAAKYLLNKMNKLKEIKKL